MNDIIHSVFSIPGLGDTVIRGDIRIDTGEHSAPVVIFCHGFKGFKDWGSFPLLMDGLARAGFTAVSFNFSHSGIGENCFEFDQLELFEENTLSLEIEDLKRVIDAVIGEDIPLEKRCCTSAIGLIGHSRGGSAVLSVGASDSRVQCVATLASITHVPQITPEQEAKWRKDEVYHILNSRTGQHLPMGLEFLEDIRRYKDRIEESARALNKPLLILHGDEDITVPIERAKELHSWVPGSELVILPGADHTFGTKHPFSGSTEHFEAVATNLNRFFGDSLINGHI